MPVRRDALPGLPRTRLRYGQKVYIQYLLYLLYLRRMTSKPKGKQVPISGYYDPDTVRRLQRLTEVTRVPQAVYLREALDDLLGKYAAILRKVK